jgi:NADPH:quinone reductase-like Zn-dependent oxidoreductase
MSQTMMTQVLVFPSEKGGVYRMVEQARPSPKAGQVLVKVFASSVNRGETQGVLKHKNLDAKPLMAGIEFSGMIESLGEGVVGWHVGDEVMARASSGFSQYALTHVGSLIKKPARLSWAQAGCVPNVFITAHDALVSGALQSGECVMVTAGSSGVGVTAIQMAKTMGAKTVIATTRSANKVEALRELGAEHVINTTQADWPEQVKRLTQGVGVNLIIDQVGSTMLESNLEVLALHGRLMTVGRNAGSIASINLDELARKNARVIGRTFRTRTLEETQACSALFVKDLWAALDNGAISPILSKTFSWEDLQAAQDYLMGNEQMGKIAIEIHHD